MPWNDWPQQRKSTSSEFPDIAGSKATRRQEHRAPAQVAVTVTRIVGFNLDQVGLTIEENPGHLRLPNISLRPEKIPHMP